MTSSSTPTLRSARSYIPDRWRTGRAAFSLVEVVMAIGIISFTLLPLIGLMTSSLNSSKTSRDEMVVASLSKEVFTTLRTNSFSVLRTLSETNYYDLSGFETNRAAAYYSCAVSNSAITLPFAGTKDMAGVRLTFSWPVGAAKPYAQIFQSAVASY